MSHNYVPTNPAFAVCSCVGEAFKLIKGTNNKLYHAVLYTVTRDGDMRTSERDYTKDEIMSILEAYQRKNTFFVDSALLVISSHVGVDSALLVISSRVGRVLCAVDLCETTEGQCKFPNYRVK